MYQVTTTHLILGSAWAFSHCPYLGFDKIVSAYHVANGAANQVNTTPDNFQLKETIQKISMFTEGLTIAYGLVALSSAMVNRYPVFTDLTKAMNENHGFPVGHSRTYLTIEMGVIFGAIALIISAITIVDVFNRYIRSKHGELDNSQRQLENGDRIEIGYNYPDQQKSVQCFHVVGIVLNVALAAFSAQKNYVTAINIASLSYSIYQLSRKKWLCLTRHFNNPTVTGYCQKYHGVPFRLVNIPFSPLINKVTAKYLFPLLANTKEDTCTGCHEVEKPDVYFCNKHVYHINCLSNLLANNSDKLIDNLKINSRYTHVDKDRGRSHVSYYATIPNNNLTCCPDCRGNPVSHELSLALTEVNNFHLDNYPTGGIHHVANVELGLPVVNSSLQRLLNYMNALSDEEAADMTAQFEADGHFANLLVPVGPRTKLIGFFSTFTEARAAQYLAEVEVRNRMIDYAATLSEVQVNAILLELEGLGALANQPEANEPLQRLMDYIYGLSDEEADQFFAAHVGANPIENPDEANEAEEDQMPELEEPGANGNQG